MTIEDHRAAYHADLHIGRLVSRQPPTALDLNTGVLHEEPGARVGMSMSGRLLRYLGHPEGYGDGFPWSRALWHLRHHCRRTHPQHRAADRPYWRGSLCHQMVSYTIIRGWDPEHAAQIMNIPSPEPVLSQALRYIEEALDDYRDRAEKRAREDAGLAEQVNVVAAFRERHDMGGLHAEDCPQCMTDRAANGA